ncbi:unnamed protein product [Polarella glacialis]|uniref:VWFA domain-containing protein n=1 Tax=Polarella glacialis TaxID=89957 RepID=A0A813GDJ0_POLGL|nr:unnamed protein product [Polarella glacialis]
MARMMTDFRIDVIPSKDLESPQDMVPILVRLTGPVGTERTASDFCCVLDTSGSMGQEATITGADGTTERHGLSLLDVAKHGVRTVAHSLSSADRLCIVAFSSTADLTLELTAMDEAGKALLEEKLDQLKPHGGTDIWAGLESGLDLLQKGCGALGSGRFGHIMLLTDGESEKRDIIAENLLKYRQKYERLPCTVSTFGFGYCIDSKLLQDLAEIGDGSYCFIPDAGFVGTCFVNTMSNLLVAAARDVLLMIEPKDGAKILSVDAGHEQSQAQVPPYFGGGPSDTTLVRLGTLHYGQSKDVIVRMSAPNPGACLTARAMLITPDSAELQWTEASVCRVKSDWELVEPQLCRAKFVDTIDDIMRQAAGQTGTETVARWGPRPAYRNVTEDQLKTFEECLKALVAEMQASPAAGKPAVTALLEDVAGQALEAISRKDFFMKWGHLYLPSLMFAHRLQQCNNFKDPGVQHYGGSLFESARDAADEMFNKLPAPKASAGCGGALGALTLNMAAYNNRYSGCIDGSCSVSLAHGEQRLVSDLVRGDKVQGAGGAVAEILCVVRQCPADGRAPLVRLPGGALVTAYHPVQVAGDWVFPADLAPVELQTCRAMFNFVLTPGASSLCVNGIPCVVLGHGLQVGAAKHPYYSSARAVDDVANRRGFKEGLVELPENCALRDLETGLVCGLQPEE